MTVRIRRATSADEAVLANIRLRAIREIAGPAATAERAEAWATRIGPDRIPRAIREHEVWIAEDDEALGWIEIDGDRIAGLYVSPDHARRGVGSELMRFAEEAIGAAGHPSARLEASENALSFYLHRGYLDDGPQLEDTSWPLRKPLPRKS